MRTIRASSIPRVPASEAEKEFGRQLASYSALERIKKLLPKLTDQDRRRLEEVMEAAP